MIEQVIEQIETEIVAAERRRDEIRKRYEDDSRTVKDEISRLRASLRSLRGERRKTTRAPSVSAGPKALAAVREALAGGPITQAQIVRSTGLNDGTVSYAVRALIESGAVEPTGQVIERSREFRLKRARRVA